MGCMPKFLQLDLNGAILATWSPAFNSTVTPLEIIIADDSNLVIAGQSDLNSGDVFISKVNSLNGSIIWQRNYGDVFRQEFVRRIALTPDGGFILTGDTYDNTISDYDIFLLKTDFNGNIK